MKADRLNLSGSLLKMQARHNHSFNRSAGRSPHRMPLPFGGAVMRGVRLPASVNARGLLNYILVRENKPWRPPTFKNLDLYPFRNRDKRNARLPFDCSQIVCHLRPSLAVLTLTMQRSAIRTRLMGVNLTFFSMSPYHPRPLNRQRSNYARCVIWFSLQQAVFARRLSMRYSARAPKHLSLPGVNLRQIAGRRS